MGNFGGVSRNASRQVGNYVQCMSTFDKKIWLPDWISQETLFKMAVIFSVCT